MRFDDVLTILNDVPDYQVFLTVDELKASTHQLANAHPNTVEVLPIGHSRQTDPIEAIKIGDGPRQALLFAMPHPDEPIGSMMRDCGTRVGISVASVGRGRCVARVPGLYLVFGQVH